MKFFSITSLLIVVGVAVWMSIQSFSRDVELVAPSQDMEGRDIIAPIDQAKQAKELIESRIPR